MTDYGATCWREAEFLKYLETHTGVDCNTDPEHHTVYLCALINTCIGGSFYISLGLGCMCEISLATSNVEKAVVRVCRN